MSEVSKPHMKPDAPRIGGVHNPFWIKVFHPNAVPLPAKAGHEIMYTEFWNRAEKRRRGFRLR